MVVFFINYKPQEFADIIAQSFLGNEVQCDTCNISVSILSSV